jgi:outer membrane protein assembly factor BamB
MIRKTIEVTIGTVVLAALGAGVVLAADWPQWRGPDRDGHGSGTGLIRSIPEGGPPVAWTADGLGAGYSSVAVVDGRVFTLGDRGDRQYAVAVDAGGTVAWTTDIGPAWKDEYLGARSTPTVEGGAVFVLSTEGVVHALSAADGEVVWKVDLVERYGARLMKAMGQYDWKFAESPLVDGAQVIVSPGTRDAAMVALDRKTGAERWRTAIPELGEKGADGAAYASAVISEGGGVRQYVQFLGRGVIGVEAKSGRLLWSYNRVANEIANIPTPLVDGDLVFVSSGYGTGAALLELSGKDGGVRARERYFLEANVFQNHHGGMILDEGTVYAGTAHNKGFPIAVDLVSGKVLWGPERNDGEGSAAVGFADGVLVFRYQNGRVVFLEATRDAYRELGSFVLPDVQQFSWSHPAIVDGRLYLREQDRLWVYDLRGAKSEPSPADVSAEDTSRP